MIPSLIHLLISYIIMSLNFGIIQYIHSIIMRDKLDPSAKLVTEQIIKYEH